jgi:hypothetical protein
MTKHSLSRQRRPALAILGFAVGFVVNPGAAIADYTIFPTQSAAVDASNRLGQPVAYNFSPFGNIGQGQGITLFHDIVSYFTFDLSGVQGTISGLEITGSVPNLHSFLSAQPTYADENLYASLGVAVTVPGSTNLSDPQAIYTSVHGASSRGSFIVDSGVPDIFHPQPKGPNFALEIDSAISSIQGGTLALGLYVSNRTDPGGGVVGDLAIQLNVSVVPEPTSLTLTALVLTLVGCHWFVRRADSDPSSA